MENEDLKRQVSSGRPRDEKGKFIGVPDYRSGKTPLEKFLLSHTGNTKDDNDLLDIRIGNPLIKIVKLLEDIKNQKAFSFTIKGSLGIAGVVLAISLFGLLGGEEILCNGGTRSFIGTLRVLEYREIYSEKIPVVNYLMDYFQSSKKQIVHRTVLLTDREGVITIPYKKESDFSKYNETGVILTGAYNSCKNTLEINTPDGIERY